MTILPAHIVPICIPSQRYPDVPQDVRDAPPRKVAYLVRCAGRELECNFGFVGADSGSGRVCVPYTPPVPEQEPPELACGNDGQPVCEGGSSFPMFPADVGRGAADW